MRTEPTHDPDQTPAVVPSKRARRKAPPGAKALVDWLSANESIAILGAPANFRNWASIVEANGIRTKLIPGTSYPLFWRLDVERVASAAVSVGMPERQASA